MSRAGWRGRVPIGALIVVFVVTWIGQIVYENWQAAVLQLLAFFAFAAYLIVKHDDAPLDESMQVMQGKLEEIFAVVHRIEQKMGLHGDHPAHRD